MKDIYSCSWFDNEAEAAANACVAQPLSDPNKMNTDRVTKAWLQIGRLDVQGLNNAVAA